jgi:hypothetical protein
MTSDDPGGSMSPTRRALLGFLIAPAMPNVLIFFLAIIQGRPGDGLWWATLMLPASYTTSAVIGAPVVIFLQKINRNGLFSYFISGLMVSLIPISFILIIPWIKTYGLESIFTFEAFSQYKIAFLMVPVGVIISTIFWVIARPDRLLPVN